MSETTLTTPSTITPLQSMLHEGYALRELWTNPVFAGNVAYTGSNAKFTLDGSFNLTYSGGTLIVSAGGITVSGGALTVSGGDITTTSTRSILVTGSGGLGYGTGSGGTVAQATNKGSAVTLNKTCGAITLNNSALGAGAAVAFALSNNTIAATDVVTVNVKSGYATAATYQAWAEGAGAGSCAICLRNISAGSLSEAVVLTFVVTKGVVA